MRSAALLTGCVLVGLALNSPAQVVPTYQTSTSSPDAFASDIAPNLIQSGQSSLAGVTADTSALSGVFNASGLNDGSAAGNGNLCYYEVGTANGTSMPNTATFQLTAAYSITSVQVISGWTDHNLGEQSFQLNLSINGGAFSDFGTFNNNTAFGTGGAAQGSYLTTLNGSAGTIATDVTGVQFIFMNPDLSNGAGNVGTSQAGNGSTGGTVIDELQVFGTPTPVPEPATSALFGAGILGVAAVFRRRLAC
jgi:hypothetical protein